MSKAMLKSLLPDRNNVPILNIYKMAAYYFKLQLFMCVVCNGFYINNNNNDNNNNKDLSYNPEKSSFPYAFQVAPHFPERRHYFKPITPTFLWCEGMWNRQHCGMKCNLLRKICDNATKSSNSLSRIQPLSEDLSSSHSMAYSTFKLPPPASYYDKLYYPSIKYARISNAPNIYHAYGPYWQHAYYRRYNPFRHVNAYMFDEDKPSISPYFSFPDQLKVTTTTEAPEESTNSVLTTTTTTTEKPATSTSSTLEPAVTTTAMKTNSLAAKVKVSTFKPTSDVEVQTISPLLLDYDQFTKRRYYGDRIYMSAHMPVSDREGKTSSFEFDDFDEAFFA